MYVKLFVRNGNTAAVEDLLGGFEKIEINRPIVCGLCPYAEVNDKGAFCLFANTDENGMIGILMNHKLVHIGKIVKGFLCKLDIGIVSNTDLEINAAKLFCAVIHNGGVGKRAVGNGNDLVVKGCDGGVENTDIANRTKVRARFNAVANAEGLENENHDTACEIGKTALQSKTDGKAAGSNHGGDCGSRDTDVCGNDGGKKNVERNLDDVNDERLGVAVNLLEFFAFGNRFDDAFDYEGTNEKNQKGSENFEAVSKCEIQKTVPKICEKKFKVHFENLFLIKLN